MNKDEYFAVATGVFPAPVNLRAAAKVMVGVTAIIELNQVHTETTRVSCFAYPAAVLYQAHLP
jgi:hypothetical protein